MPSKKKYLKIYVSDQEHEQLKARMIELGCSMSHFGKIALLGYKHPSKTDFSVLQEVSKYQPAIRQVGGLMKLFLAQYPNDLAAREIRTHLNQIEAAHKAAEALFREVAEFILEVKAK